MEYLHIMVPVAIIIVAALIGLLFWSVRTGQFDDLERQGFNILLDDETPETKNDDKETPNKHSSAKSP
ncbi:cbb3-type cytochrome oxidase assembly protein CcoS [Aliidiomarina taiwanensis]|uniref:Cbb3-type cytochrome oxidase assembly protein CcoS n=1 Tax=Aliidiomarina taiwanensis TaxID=946228 RepID=A0A432X9V4_9GAMM|nr:cbb3-type cytochrome oxidase assembly protein CcoS [Aliidiomarina taiwanensis]RUO44167.1 cbb3-type cytochrome oxidase assembly protein CcoS [Aliidiomarina taiwanensis]